MSPQQIEQFKSKAKAMGKSDAQINAFIRAKQQEAQSGLFAPKAPASGELWSRKTPSVEEPKKSVGGFVGNIFKSGGSFIKNTAVGLKDVIAHPKRTLESIGDPLAGAAMLGIKKATGTTRFDNAPEIDKAKAVGGFYKDRYGGVDQIKNTLYKDPVGVLSDISTVASLGGAAVSKVGTISHLGSVAKAGSVLSKAGDLTNPFSIASRTAGAVAKPFSNALHKSAVTQYSKALAPTTKETKFLTDQVVPGLLKKGEKSLTLKGLENKAQSNLTKYGQKLDDAEAAIHPNTSVKVKPILDDLDNYEQQFYTNRSLRQGEAIPVSRLSTAKNSLSVSPVGEKPGAIAKAMDDLKAGKAKPVKVRQLEDGSLFIEDGRHRIAAAQKLGMEDLSIEDVTSKYGPGKLTVPVALEPDKIKATRELRSVIKQFGDDVPFESLQKVKRVWAETIAESKGYMGKTFSEGSKLKVKDIATDSIRGELAKNFPDLDKINKEYSFWKKVEKVTSETIKRKSGQGTPFGQQMAQNMGQGAGLIRGTAADAIFIGSALKNATKLFQSAGYRMLSASVKYRLATLIAAGDMVGANNLVLTLLNTVSLLERQKPQQVTPIQSGL